MSKHKDYINSIDGAERRYFNPNIEVRAGDEEDGMIKGVAAVVGSRTDLDWFEEEIMPGAFDDVMKDDVKALFNHDPNLILARSNAGKGTLRLFLDKSGNLGFEYKTPDRSYARDLENAIGIGDISQCSFAFRVGEVKWTYASEDNGMKKDLRTIVKFERLYDVSPVTYPAYADTSVAKRSAELSKPELSGIAVRQRIYLYHKIKNENKIGA